MEVLGLITEHEHTEDTLSDISLIYLRTFRTFFSVSPMAANFRDTKVKSQHCSGAT